MRRRAVVYAPNALGRDVGKTANDLVIYSDYNPLFNVKCVVDPSRAGIDAGVVVGVGFKGIPVVESLDDAISKYKLDALIVGVAPVGGVLPGSWISDLKKALENGLDIYSGMHTFLSEHEELLEAARKSGAKIHDIRKPRREEFRIWSGDVLKCDCKRVLVAGSDCGVGKNIACIELSKELGKRGVRNTVIATGQTMILLGFRGSVIDAIPSDFTPGVVEKYVVDACRESDVVIVEGQGAILHPAYGQVTLAILYGVSPTNIVLCHDPSRRFRAEFNWLELPDPSLEVKALLELNPNRNSRLTGICLNTSMYELNKAREVIREFRGRFNVPVTDPLRMGVSEIIDFILEEKL